MLTLEEVSIGILSGVIAGAIVAGVNWAVQWYFDTYTPIRVLPCDPIAGVDLYDILHPEREIVEVNLQTVALKNRSMRRVIIRLRGDPHSGFTSPVGQPLMWDGLRPEEWKDHLPVEPRELKSAVVRWTLPKGLVLRLRILLWVYGFRGTGRWAWSFEVDTRPSTPVVRSVGTDRDWISLR